MPVDSELEQFKAAINLSEYAAAVYGYRLDHRISSENCKMMRDGADDKLGIARDEDGHWVYYSYRSSVDFGSIIDFVQNREHCTLGRVRQLLRPWIGHSPVFVPGNYFAKAVARSFRDLPRVQALYSRMPILCRGRHPYLQSRGIRPGTLTDARFARSVRVDSRRNAVFPHYNSGGLCGYELKNQGFTGFAKGGAKGLWFSRNASQCLRLYVVEAAIDALSHAQLFPDPDAGYLSIGGQPNDTQPRLLERAIIKATKRNAKVLIATDADAGGDSLAALVAELSSVPLERALPGAKDWNALLLAGEHDGNVLG